MLKKVWNSKLLKWIKIKLFFATVESAPLYLREMWIVTEIIKRAKWLQYKDSTNGSKSEMTATYDRRM